MKQIYTRSFTVTFSTGDSGYVYGEKVPAGHVLCCCSSFAYSPERDPNDCVILGINDGGEEILIFGATPLAAQRGVANDNMFWIGEGDQPFAYFPDAEDGDTIALHIIGILESLDEWRRVPI